MAVEIILPRVDMDMATGRFTQWFFAEGESVAKGKPLFEIETDKAAMEVDAPVNGILRGVTAKPGDVLPVGSVIGWLCAVGEVFAAPRRDAVAEVAAGPSPAARARVEAAPSAAPSEGLRATPKARHLARLAGLDIAKVKGSGPHGRVQARDIALPAHLPAGVARLHGEWLARGDGAPIVFVHGFGADLQSWRPLIGHLPPGRGALAIDLPGHGRSALGGALSLEALAEALLEALAAEGVTGLHWVGHSLGAAVAAACAARRPQEALSLTLLSPAGLGPEINGAFLEGFLGAQSEASLAPWMRLLATQEEALGPALVKTTLRQRRDLGLAGPQAELAAALFPDGTQAFDVRPALAKYPGPSKVIFGAHDRIIPAHHALGLPGAVAVHVFADVGHMPHFEARSEIASLIGRNFASARAH